MKIGIIGASSQVGSSVALYLKLMGYTNITCFLRSNYSNIFFEIFEIPSKQIDFNNQEALKQVLNEYDVIADFTYPVGQLFEIPKLIERNTNAITACMKKEASYIYMSSIMAYGTPIEDNYISNYIIPRSSYAFIKRKAENFVKRACSKNKIKPYIFRLGQVHGFLQSVSHSYKKNLSKQTEYLVNGNSDDKTNTIFISTICDAILKCAEQKVQPGLYTLVSQPQWTLKQIYEYYIEQYDIQCQVKFVPFLKPQKRKGIKEQVISILKSKRFLIENYLLINKPNLAIKLKGRYRVEELKATINFANTNSKDYNLLGKPLHTSVDNAQSNYELVKEIEQKTELTYNSIIKANTNEF